MVNLKILSEDDKNLIHHESLKILEQAGIKLESRKLLDMLKSKGCIVDDAECIVKFPPDIIEKALKTAPKKFILGGLEPKNDMFLGEGNSYVTTDGQSCFIYDEAKGERREAVMQDLLDAARIVDSLRYINCFWPVVSASDVPEEVRTLCELVRGYRVLGKHFQTDCFSEVQAKYYIKILETILGSREKVIERKIFSVVCCSVSPLSFEPEMMEGCAALTEIEVPIVILPMPISGMTAPMTMLGTIIMNNVEVLAGLAIFQLQRPGTPVIYGSAPGSLDMLTTLFCVGSPESMLQNVASAEMGKWYELPNLVSVNCTEAKEPDIQCGREKVSGSILASMVGADLLCGVGVADTSNLYYPELLVLDEDSIGYAKRLANGVKCDKEHALTDEIIQIGAFGSFLAEKSTRKFLRNGEHYHPTATVRKSFEIWSETPGGDVRSIARKKVSDILAAPEKTYINDDLMARLEAILSEAEAELC